MAKIKRKKGYLALATGRVFEGHLFGAPPPEEGLGGEVVFNTSMTGYQEILTDPSYQGQIVMMTASHIGNTGINPEDMESHKIFLSGFVVQEVSSITSNWRSTQDLDGYMASQGIVGIAGIDTRALTRYLRTQGSVNGLISGSLDKTKQLISRARALPHMEGQDLVKKVTADKPYEWTTTSGEWTSFAGQSPTARQNSVVVMDFGVKQNILRCLADLNCKVTVMSPLTEPCVLK